MTLARTPSSVRNVRRKLTSARFCSYRPARVPALTQDHRSFRLQWSRDDLNWQVRHWCQAVFADESRFALYCHDGRQLVNRQQGERLPDGCVNETRANRTLSVMVCGTIHYGAKSELVFVDGTPDCFQYVDILRSIILPYARPAFEDNFVLVQANASYHTASQTRCFLTQEQVEVMPWPVNSPDMNPIEHVWDQMDIYTRDMATPPTHLDELRQAVQQAWDAVTVGSTQTLVNWMPRRVRVLLDAHGDHTRY